MVDRPASLSQQLHPDSSSEVSMIAVSKEMDLTKALLVILRKMLVDDKNTALLILSSMPVEQLIVKSKDFGLDLELFLRQKSLVILDCLTKFTESEESTETPMRSDVHYVSSPSDLAEISVKVGEALAEELCKGEKWMILDSITTLSLYNSTGGFLRFMQFLFKKLLLLHFDGIMIVVRDVASDSMIQSLQQYCDKIIFLAPSKEA
jgi:archaellum biogenesis ATPase FlaH